ncbi:MAG TPA: hypothetical protein VE912_11625, partial [Bacteroidales bacterium]|nr:hypothetical protein [Bacteroidales bacterium]
MTISMLNLKLREDFRGKKLKGIKLLPVCSIPITGKSSLLRVSPSQHNALPFGLWVVPIVPFALHH